VTDTARRMRQVETDELWMRRALSLASRGEGKTRPNPPVGAIVVKNGRAAGNGFHKKAGGPHAEVIAIRDAGRRAKGATLYVTLEPCSTYGRTPPCTDLIIESGIARVVIAMRDPNPRHNGRGIVRLKKAGIKLVEGVCSAEASQLLAPFAKWITTRRPYLTLKLGMSLDGRIADAAGKSKWITGEKSRALVQALRCRSDTVLVGGRTARVDDPSLLCRSGRSPGLVRVVVDSSGKLPLNSVVLNDGGAAQTIVATTRRCTEKQRQRYARKGATVIVLPNDKDGHVSVKSLFTDLGRLGLLHVVCEGGGELAYSLINAGLVDEYLIFLAPRLIGGHKSVPAIGGQGWMLRTAPELAFKDCERVGDDFVIRAVPRK
jgi:diaminohydroxyphosphoribosylaminopyrimidine deaminase / 5-amino-6-(5-phosphoribosylamino)uracil reductase